MLLNQSKKGSIMNDTTRRQFLQETTAGLAATTALASASRASGAGAKEEIVVGLIGAWMHLQADLHAPAESLRDRIVYGAPIFAPLLFADIAILALLGLWCLGVAPPSERVAAGA